MTDPSPPLPPLASPGSPGEHADSTLHPGLLDRLRRRRQRLWRRTRRVVRWSVGSIIVLAAGTYVTSQSFVVGMVVRSRVRALANAQAEFDSAVVDLDGRLVIQNLRVRSTDLNADAARVLSAQSAVIELDWSDVLSGNVAPLAVRLFKPAILLSQSTVDQSLNLATIAANAPQAAGGTALPPEITITEGTLVFAEHDAAGSVTPLRTLHVSGALLPVRSAKPAYLVAITEDELPGAPRVGKGMVLSGNIDLADGSAALRLYDLALHQWPPEAVPSAYRDIWRRLNLRGDITRVELTSSRQTGVAIDLEFRDVALNALIPKEPDHAPLLTSAPAPASPPPQTDLALTGVSGNIRIARDGLQADLEGLIEGQTGLNKVTLRTHGLDAAAPLNCSIQASSLQVTNDSAILAYIPSTVREYLAIFSGPTGDLTISANIARGSPVAGQPAPLNVSGVLRLRNCTAAFHKFPYRFTDISGQIEFDETRLIISGLRGRGPTGAKLAARGVVSPLTADAKVEVQVDVSDLPLDTHLLDAMSDDHRAAARSLADRPAYERLLNAGLIRPPGALGIDGTRFAPPFPFAGDSNVSVRVLRQAGPDDDWSTTIDARFDQLGLITPKFALPVIGRNVRLRMTDATAELLSGDFVGLRGGTVGAEVKVTFFRDDHKVFEPRLEFIAEDLPVDDLMMEAIRGASGAPQSADPAGSAPNDSLFSDALDRLQLAGHVSGHALISAEPQPDGTPAPLDYVVTVKLADLRAIVGPTAASGDTIGPLALADFLGNVRLSPERVRVNDLQARLVRTSGDVGPTPASDAVGPFLAAGAADAGVFSLSLNAALPGAEDHGLLDVRLGVQGLNLADPVEQVLAVLSPPAADWITQRRAERNPVGSIDFEAHASRPAGAAPEAIPDLRITLNRVHDVAFSTLGGRLRLDAQSGAITARVPPNAPLALSADALAADVSFNEDLVGHLSVSGALSVDLDTQRIITPAQAAATITGCDFAAPVIPIALRSLAGPTAADRFSAFDPTGRFDALLRLSDAQSPPGVEPAIAAVLSPHELSIRRDQRRIAFQNCTGQIEIDAPSPTAPDQRVTGRIVDLNMNAPDWSVRIDGPFSVLADSSPKPAAVRPLELDLALSLSAEQLNDDLLAFMPRSTRQMLEQAHLKIDGPIDVVDARLVSAPDGSPRFDGAISFNNASLNPGLPIDHASGTLIISPEVDALANEVSNFELDLIRLWVRGVAMRNLSALTRFDDSSGRIEIQRAAAECHGGRILVSGSITPTDTPPRADSGEASRIYRVEVVASDLAFASLLDDLIVASGPAPFVGPRQDFTADPDLSRGRLDARLGISGYFGDPASRVGSGALRVSDGNVLRLPLLFPLMQLSNLVIPSDDQLRWAEAEFFLDADRLVFERAIAAGDTIALHGSGQVLIPGAALDFTFNSRAVTRLPLLSAIWEAVRNEIVTTHITGTLDEPKVASRSFNGVQRLLASIFDSDHSPARSGSPRSPASSELRLLRDQPPPPRPPVPPPIASADAPSETAPPPAGVPQSRD